MRTTQTIAEKVRGARLRSSLSMGDLSRLAGVSQPTVSRIESGAVTPSAGVYLALLAAAGFYDDGTRIVPVSRPSATWTARWLLGDLDTKPDDADEWLARWQRIRLVTDGQQVADVEGLLFRAGRCAVLSRRPDAVAVSNCEHLTACQLAARLADADVECAVTGDEGLERMGAPLVAAWPVLYVADLRAAMDATGATRLLPGERDRGRATYIPFDGTSEAGRWRSPEGTWFASQVQIVLDGYGGYGRMVEQTEILVKTLEEQR